MMKSHLKWLFQSTAALALVVGTANSQDVETLEDQTPLEQEAGDDEVVVTGSRIRKDTFSSPVSMDVLEVDDAQIEGIADIAGLLQTSTAASGSSQITAAVSTAFVAQGGVGSETVGLRGLGANRTLDLINGRRAGPSGTRGSISSFDLGSIPLVGMERVDILKDGASSVYGSDAIAGVINYITDKSDGGEVDLFTSLPEDTGGQVFRASATYGDSFDKGRFRVTGDYYKAKELARKDRAYLDCNESMSFTDSSLTTRADVIDPRTGNFQCGGTIWGHVWVYDYGSDNIAQNPRNLIFQYDYPGDNLGNFIPAIPTSLSGFGLEAPPGWFQVEYTQDHIDGLPAWAGIDVTDFGPDRVTNLYPEMQRRDSVTPEVERMTLMGDVEFDLSDDLSLYAEGLFNRRQNYVNGHKQYWTYQYGNSLFGTPNPFPLDPQWGGPLSWFSPTPVVEHGDEEVTIDYFRLVGGLKGGLDSIGLDGWDFDIYSQYSDSHGEYWEQHVRADAIFPYNFGTSSCAGTTTPGASGEVDGETITIDGVPCTDVRWFDPYFLAGQLNDAERAMLLDDDFGYTDFDQWTVEGYVTGDLINLPAGKLGAAVGLFHQRDEIYDRPSDTTLLGNEFFGSSAGITTGVQKTNAVYGELSVPILKDEGFAQELSATVSGRYSEITSEHQDGRSVKVDGFNYRATLDWRMNDWIRLRASQGTSFRAPGLFEQFLADESSSARQSIDPCRGWGDLTADDFANFEQIQANCAAEGIPDDYVGAPISVSVLTGGGFGLLEPETSKNFTVGGVLSPDFDFADISFAVDYFDIEVKDEIDSLSAGLIVSGCYGSTDFANEPLCDLVDRGFELSPPDPTVPNRIANVRASFININSQRNRGLDFTLRANKDTKWGDFSFNAQASRQLEDEIDLVAESQTQFLNGSIGEPYWTGFANLTFQPKEDLSLRWGIDYIGAQEPVRNINLSTDLDDPTAPYDVTQLGQTVFWKTELEPTIYHSFSAEAAMPWGVTLRAGINNIFDEHPAASSIAASAGNTPLIASQYDLLGRRLFLNVSKQFD